MDFIYNLLRTDAFLLVILVVLVVLIILYITNLIKLRKINENYIKFVKISIDKNSKNMLIYILLPVLVTAKWRGGRVGLWHQS